ncbi:MAG: hypothetical protein ABIQ88_07245 [Chitinophagaceae bacterium]
MRTSNKIILGIFLGPLIILISLQLALYAKYKSGHYVILKSVQEDRFLRPVLKNISTVTVYGLNNFHVHPADTLRLEIEKDKKSHLHYTVNGNALIIHGDSVVRRPGNDDDVLRSYQDVNLYLPAGGVVTADNSEVILHGSKDSVKAGSYQFSLVNAASLKVDQNGDDAAPIYFKGLAIQASHAAGIQLMHYARVFDLKLNLIQSAFSDEGAFIDKLVVDTDTLSNISLKGDNLRKIIAAH